MEGIALILIGTAIFTHSWYLLGLYADGRTVGVIMASLAVGLVLSLFTFDMQFLGSLSDKTALNGGETASLKSIIIIWAVYAAAVAAHGLWDMEERATGFYSVLLTVSSIVFLLFFLQLWVSDNDVVVALPLVIVSAMTAIVGGLLFFCLAIPFLALRAVSGWAMLIQSIVIAAIGLAMVTAVIQG